MDDYEELDEERAAAEEVTARLRRRGIVVTGAERPHRARTRIEAVTSA